MFSWKLIIFGSFISFFGIRRVLLFIRSSLWQRCHLDILSKLSWKTVLITGTTSGIGRSLAFELAKYNANLIMLNRDERKSLDLLQRIKLRYPKCQAHSFKLDVSVLQDIRNFVEMIDQYDFKINILINNAGVSKVGTPITNDGIRYDMAVNYIGPFLLSHLLIEKNKCLEKIINVTSSLDKYGHFEELEDITGRDMDINCLYKNSKLALTLHTYKMNKSCKQYPQIVFIAVHPGIVITNLARNIIPNIIKYVFLPFAIMFLKVPFEGAQCILYCAAVASSSGYYGSCKENWPRFCSEICINKIDNLHKNTLKICNL